MLLLFPLFTGIVLPKGGGQWPPEVVASGRKWSQDVGGARGRSWASGAFPSAARLPLGWVVTLAKAGVQIHYVFVCRCGFPGSFASCVDLAWHTIYLSPGGGEGTNHASRHPPPSGGPSSTGRRDT